MLNQQDLLKVENETGLYRDPVSKSIINKDNISYTKYMKHRQRIIESQSTIEKNTKDIDNIKNELDEIKEMLAKILVGIQK